MRKLLSLLLALVATTCLWAHDFKVNGIYYNYLEDNNVEVTFKGDDYFEYTNEYSGAVTIPETVTYSGTTYSVKSIGNWAFYDCSSLTSITIPNSVTSIGHKTFLFCSSLASVTIGNSVKSIGNCAFANCSSLTSVTIPNSVTSIGDQAFLRCSSLTSVTIPNSVTSIGDEAFADCSSLTSITIPNSVTSIGILAFYDCSSLTTPVYNAHCFAYMPTSFEGAYVIPEGIKQIAGGAFYNCSSLTSITIPNSVTSIGDYAFYECASLKDISIPNSVTTLGQSVFENCISLKSAYVGNGITSLDNSTFISCSSLESLTLGGRIVHIGESVFSGCTALNEITLPASVKSIGKNAFAGCTKLYDIYCFAMEPPTAYESSFANYNAFLHVPCDNQRVYLLDVLFGDFKFIECIDSEDATTDGNVTVVPGFNDVTITWPTTENADTYSLVINKAGEPFCTLTFNQDGQLLNIAFAPSREGNNRPVQYAEQTVNGYRFTVTGLTEATKYAYDITTKDAAKQTIAAYSGEFTTKGGTTTDMDNIQSPVTICQKIMRNGQLIILRDGKTYTTMGAEIQ